MYVCTSVGGCSCSVAQTTLGTVEQGDAGSGAIWDTGDNDTARIIASPSGWLNDNIIDASQKLLAQHFPDWSRQLWNK